MVNAGQLAPQPSPTGRYFAEGRSCGECLLLAARLRKGQARAALVRAVRGLAGGKAGMCTLMVAGSLALAESKPEPEATRQPVNDYLESFVPAGWPGSDVGKAPPAVAEFMTRFEAHAKRLGAGTMCHEISGADWDGGAAASVTGMYRRDKCIALADAAVADLDELLPAAGPRAPSESAAPRKSSAAAKASADPESAL
jgi:hypothetical protein